MLNVIFGASEKNEARDALDFSGSPTAKCVTVVTCKYDDIVVLWDNMYTKCYLREEMLTKHSQSARGRMAFTWKRIAHGLD